MLRIGTLNVYRRLLIKSNNISKLFKLIYFQTHFNRFDIGPVLFKKSLPLDDHIRAPELLAVLADLGAGALIQVIQDLTKYLKNPVQQDHSLATLAPKLTVDMAEVDWESQSAVEIYRLFRGLYGTFKLRTTFNERRVDLDDIEVPVISSDLNNNNCNISGVDIKFPSNGPVGQIYFTNERIYIRCANSSGVATWICVNKFKIGTKWMTSKDFRNGYLSKGKFVGGIPRFYRSKSVVEDKYILRNS